MKIKSLLSVLLLFISVELHSQQQPKRKHSTPAKPIIHILKVDTPLQVNVNSIPSRKETVVIDGSSTIQIKQEGNVLKDYVVPILAPIFTLLGVFLGSWLTRRRERIKQAEDRRQKIIDDLNTHKIRAENLIQDLQIHFIDANQASKNISSWESVNNVKTLGRTKNYDKEIAQAEASLEYNSKRIKEILSEFRQEVGFFHRYFNGNIMFKDMVEYLKEFDPDLEKLKGKNTFDESVIIGNEFIDRVSYFSGNILRRFTDLIDYYLREVPFRNEEQTREFEINVWHNGTTFTTEKPPENPSGSVKQQLKDQKKKT